ncbi:MAG: transposase, partial [Synergistaceae bacterium]|nr:transposase [Synergistaceae bacterium]
RKCLEYGIELRIADRFYASSKTCSRCEHVKKDLKLKDRVYECTECGLVVDRDYNAALNLRSCMKYRTAG